MIYKSGSLPFGTVMGRLGGFVDLTNSNLVRIPKSIIDGVKFDKKIEMNYLPRKIKLDNKNNPNPPGLPDCLVEFPDCIAHAKEDSNSAKLILYF